MEYLEKNKKFFNALYLLGFDFKDCPSCEIKKQWESMPIIKAIRQSENITGIKYNDIYDFAENQVKE